VKAIAAWLRKWADRLDPPKPPPVTPDVGGGGGPPEPV